NNRHPEFKHGSMAEERHSGRSYLSTAIGEEGDVLCKNFFQFFLVASFTGFQEGFHKALLLIVIRLEARPRALDFFPRSMEDLPGVRSEEHTSELQSRENLVCRLLLEKKKNTRKLNRTT